MSQIERIIRDRERAKKLYPYVYIALYGCWLILLIYVDSRTFRNLGISQEFMWSVVPFIIVLLGVVIVKIINEFLEQDFQQHINSSINSYLRQNYQKDNNQVINNTDNEGNKHEITKPTLTIVESSREKVRKRMLKNRMTGHKPVKKKHPKKQKPENVSSAKFLSSLRKGDKITAVILPKMDK